MIKRIGSTKEKNWLQNLEERENAYANKPMISFGTKNWNFNDNIKKSDMVVSEVVVGCDGLKFFLASLRCLFGGEVKILDKVIDIGRREALIRLKEQAPQSDVIIGVKIKTAMLNTIGQGFSPQCAIIASGTAITFNKKS